MLRPSERAEQAIREARGMATLDERFARLCRAAHKQLDGWKSAVHAERAPLTSHDVAQLESALRCLAEFREK